MAAVHTEQRFEEAVETHLLAHGYRRGERGDFDPELALDPVQLLTFVKETQPREWRRLEQRHGVGVEQKFLARVKAELEARGTLAVLRQGVTDYGVRFQLAYFRPAHTLAPEVQARYEQNRLTVTRQVRYSARHQNELDLVLAVNGLPVATAELKNPLSGQTVQHAIRQYKEDRDPRDLLLAFKKRAVVHFAVDPDEVYMTTQLRGVETRFLPFNKGRGEGKQKGAGNPDNAHGYKTAYLWEEVWERESWLDLLGRFIHLQRADPTSRHSEESLIFPRYHQWQATRAVEADAAQHGPGRRYLVQHSAGSGKSNTIAWLAHSLFRLHDGQGRLLFDTVVVITDRRVLDRQLQGTVGQFEQTSGVVVNVDRDSAQLARALDEGRHIVVTTLQKFPFVLGRIDRRTDRAFAVIVDEAHSSQTGEAARTLRTVLSPGEAAQDATELIEGDFEDELGTVPLHRLKNLTFVALTATPKAKTIELFGTRTAEGAPRPFHVYSMRQAIEEGFILDVLQNYVTYKRYWRLERAIKDDPELPARRARVEIARYVDLHPHNIAQKTAVIVEHYRRFSRYAIGGRAKAMVVTRSRLHAVRYKLAVDAYLKAKGYDSIKALVAFSGTVIDPETSAEYTEPRMNGFSESQLPDRFARDDYQVLLVAEKYQTGFDQPLLQAMYVDKRLDGIKAVQTLSRLNRTYPGKADTFVLDFVNDAETIRAAFAPYYDETEIAAETDPNLLYDLKTKLESAAVYQQSEIDAVQTAITADRRQLASASAILNAAIDPAVTRFRALPDAEREEVRAWLTAYTRLYSFLLHVIPFADPELEKLHDYSRFLLRKLPRPDSGGAVDVDDYVALRYYRLTKTGEQHIGLGEEGEEYTLTGPSAVGTGRPDEVKRPLSALIEKLNEAFGLDLTVADQLSFDQIEEDLVIDPTLGEQARANDPEHYAYGFAEAFDNAIVDRLKKNQSIFARLLDDPEFQQVVKEFVRPRVYERQRAAESSVPS